MAKKIYLGKTEFSELYKILKFKSYEELENKKARLFPHGNMDSEISTTSSFLASLCAIKEYREELLIQLGINKIKNKNVSMVSYTELKNKNTNDRPDGLIIITTGKHKPIIEWVGFVESKVGNNELKQEQIERYASFANEIGIKNIITISNQLVPTPTHSPIKISKRSFNLYHWSWVYLKVIALRLIRTNSVSDPDHIYMLSELRRYFDTHKFITHYVKMGKGWKESVESIRSPNTQGKVTKEVLANIATSFSQEEKDISLHLTDNSELLVELIAKDDRLTKIKGMLAKNKTINSTYMINRDKSKTFIIEVDFRGLEIRCQTTVNMNIGKSKRQTTDLIKMFESQSGTTENIFVQAYYLRNKTNNKAVSLSKLIDEKSRSEYYSLLDKELGDTVKYFKIFTKDTIGRDFLNVRNFVYHLEKDAQKFLDQVMIYRK